MMFSTNPDIPMSWVYDHYEPSLDTMSMRCKRCGMDIWALTKHAHNVHGDDIPVLPGHPSHVGKSSDHEGRLIRA